MLSNPNDILQTRIGIPTKVTLPNNRCGERDQVAESIDSSGSQLSTPELSALHEHLSAKSMAWTVWED